MALINENYLKLQAGYLFPEIGRRVSKFIEQNPNKKVIKMGIGDVTQALVPKVVEEFHKAVDEMANKSSFKGYGPEQGYSFLRELIAENDYKGLTINPDDIFISDGSKCDTGSILEIFGHSNKIAICDPVYPVYVDTNVMDGRTGSYQETGYYDNIYYIKCTEENGFCPQIPNEKVDIIYLCFPNNPTGTTASKADLTKWVNYAKENDAIILFDAAYEAFVTDPEVPKSIYEIEGAKEVAIEFRSFSKKAGFTGTRCAFTVVPEELKAKDSAGNTHSVKALWNRRHSTKFNGVSYPVQKAAAAIYTEEGKKQVQEVINYYLNNAKIMREKLSNAGYTVHGGINAPYVWVKTKNGETSWEFFDLALNKANVVGTPGSGFGPAGEHYFRFSAFADLEDVEEAMERITTKL